MSIRRFMDIILREAQQGDWDSFLREWGDFIYETTEGEPTEEAYHQYLHDLQSRLHQPIYRLIRVSPAWREQVMQDAATPLGVYWSQDRQVAKSWTGASSYDERFSAPASSVPVLLTARVAAAAVDWNASVASCFATNESEINVKPGQMLHLIGIDDTAVNLPRPA